MLRLQESLERRGRGRGRVQGLVLKPSSARPCAVWGNGLWGSVGRAGRSLPLEGLHQLWLFKPSRPCISVMVVTVARDCHHPRAEVAILRRIFSAPQPPVTTITATVPASSYTPS